MVNIKTAKTGRDAGKKSLEGPASERLAKGIKRRADGGRLQVFFAVAGTRPNFAVFFYLSIIVISTRRFLARPASVLLSAIGTSPPIPFVKTWYLSRTFLRIR